MFCLLTTCLLFIVITSNVTCVDDFDLMCPNPWIDGKDQQLVCTIPRTKFNSTACDFYVDSVEFRIVRGTSSTQLCTVTGIDTSCGSINSDGCGCTNDANNLIVVFKVKADETVHKDVGWDCIPQCFDAGGNRLLFAQNTTACFQTEFAQPPTSDGLTASQKAGIAGGLAGVSVLLLLILTLVKCKGKVFVGHDDEQRKRIDHYVKQLQEHQSRLREIERKGGFGCCDMPTKLRVNGYRSLEGNGRPRGVQEQLHIAISIRLFFLCRRSMEIVKQEVRDFLLEKVTPFKVRIVKDPGNIERQKLESIAAKTETNILPPAENRKGEMVIQIEGRDNQAVDDAKNEVMKLIQSSGSANGDDWP